MNDVRDRPPDKETARHEGNSAGRNDSHGNGIGGNPSTVPEFRNSRRAFLVAMLMCGAVKPEAVTQRIVAEIEGHGMQEAPS